MWYINRGQTELYSKVIGQVGDRDEGIPEEHQQDDDIEHLEQEEEDVIHPGEDTVPLFLYLKRKAD